MTSNSPPLVVTSGEPSGIGPDLCVGLAEENVVVMGDRNLLAQRAESMGLDVKIREWETGGIFDGRTLNVIHVPLAAPSVPGKPDAANSRYVLELLERAAIGCQHGEFSGMVTAPVHKGIINDAGIPFTGHTEFLAELTHAKQVVMMLAGGGMRVALVTTHLPLREVADAVTAELLESVLCILDSDLRRRFGIPKPRILVAGLNPHAGEGGHLGREEIEVMIPVLDRLRSEGFDVSAPIPADTLFTPERLKSCDCVLTIYHDQGLPVLKHASFGRGVNITMGLPIIRTSVDHGTALDLAGTGRADIGSMKEAIAVAVRMAESEKLMSIHPQERHFLA